MQEITYDPEFDNCAGMPGCGAERVLFTWYGEPAACCPRCYANTFGAAPEPWRIVNISKPGPAVIHLRLAERAIPIAE